MSSSCPIPATARTWERLPRRRRERAKVVYPSNPDNPMGTWWGAAEISAFIDEVPEETLVLLDEAYCETAPPDTLPSLEIGRANVIRTRTFSKAPTGSPACALAMRSVAASSRRSTGCATISRDGAPARRRQSQRWAMTSGCGAWSSGWRQFGGGSTPSRRRTGSPRWNRRPLRRYRLRPRWPFAMKVLKALERRGVFVRKPGAPGLDQHIRISVGPEAEMDVVAVELLPALREAAEGEAWLATSR